MEVKVSTKYQIVIPKAVRRQLGIKPGQKVYISMDTPGKASITLPLSAEGYVKKYAGTLKNTAWQKQGMDAAEWLRGRRDAEWD